MRFIVKLQIFQTFWPCSLFFIPGEAFDTNLLYILIAPLVVLIAAVVIAVVCFRRRYGRASSSLLTVKAGHVVQVFTSFIRWKRIGWWLVLYAELTGSRCRLGSAFVNRGNKQFLPVPPVELMRTFTSRCSTWDCVCVCAHSLECQCLLFTACYF